jgi:hypothetical protein
MKKLFITLALTVFIGLSSFAQAFYGGVEGAFQNTWFMNKAVFDRGASQDVDVTFGQNYGIVAGFMFSESFGLEVNFLYNHMGQKYVGEADPIAGILADYSSESFVNTVDVPILARFGKDAYFNIGPVISLTQAANFTYTDGSYLSEYTNIQGDNKDLYQKMFFGVALGFGGDIHLTKRLAIRAGMRFYYALQDIGGVNAYGWDKATTIERDHLYNLTHPENDDHWGHKEFSTNPLTGQLRLGVVYKVGK